MYPAAERLELVDDLYGNAVPDPYRWLEDATDPATQVWSAAQDELVDEARETWPLRPALHEALTALHGAGDVASPIWRRGRPFEWRREAGAEHGALVTTDPDGSERVLVDPIVLDPSGLTTLDYWQPSPGGDLLAYQLSTGGTELSRLWVLDVHTGAVVDGPIDRVRFSPVAWLEPEPAFYYVRHLAAGSVNDADGDARDDPVLLRRVHLHRLGVDPEADPVVFGAGSARGTYFGAQVSADGRWLTITANLGTDPRNDAWLADLSRSTPDRPELRELQIGVDARLHPYVRDGVVYLLTDRDAPRGRLCVTRPDRLEYQAWRELVAEDPVAVLEDYVVLDGAEMARPLLVVSRRRHAVSELSRHDLADGTRLGAVELPGLGSVIGLTAHPVGGREAWFTYTDFVTPSTVYQLDGRTGDRGMWRSAPAAQPATGITTRQVVYESLDGTPVRLFLITESEPGPDAPRPTILYGYGGFGISPVPVFDPVIVAWVRAGGAYAVANLRGGGEEGEQWHRAGMLGAKQNVFDDFEAAARWLVANQVTDAGTLAIRGGSNGGLLVAAAMTQHPEEFAAVVCSKPLLDMVRYEHFGLGATWAGEYGSAGDPDELGWLLSYSPYHHVRPGVGYPAVLFTVFDGDTRVDPLHARKMTAALQYASAGPGPVLLRRESDVGHAGRAVSRAVNLVADELAFLGAQLGLAPPA